MLAAELIAKYIADTGVDAAFGVVGEGNLAIVTALTDLGVHYVAARREDAAVGMADGWARRTGRTGVATATTGPGLTNTITAMTEGVRARTPMVLVTALTPPASLHNPQRVEARTHMEATGAGWREARGPAFLAADVAHVFRAAAIEGRPQVLAIPQMLLYEDVTGLLLDDTLPESLPSLGVDHRPNITPDPGAIDAIVAAVAEAKRPVIVAGRGASSQGSAEALEELAARIGAPLATTLITNGLFSDRAIGICGGLATDHGGEVITSADLVLGFGCSLNPFTTMNGDLLAGSVVVHVDRDPLAIGRWTQPEISVLADTETVARELVNRVESSTPWAPESGVGATAPDGPSPFITLDVARRLGALTAKHDVTFALDAGHAVIDVVPHLRPRSHRQFMMSTHFGSVGLGIGLAMGASVAADQWTVFLVGDGALAMSMQDLDTMRREGLGVLVVVFDDGGYGAEVHYSGARGLPDTHAFIDSPPFVGIADAMGFAVHDVESFAGMDVIDEILTGPRRPTLVRIPIHSHPMNRWYQQFSSVVEPVRWTGFSADE